MPDLSINQLPAGSSLQPTALLVVYQNGQTQSITGTQLISFANVEVAGWAQEAQEAASDAEKSAQSAAQSANVTAHPPKVNESTGVWQVWDGGAGAYQDTTIQAEGPQGASVTSVVKTSGTGAAGTTDTYTMYNSDGEAVGTFTVYNGTDGNGAGDMLKSVYDPDNKNTNIFAYADNVLSTAESYTNTAIQSAILDSWEAAY